MLVALGSIAVGVAGCSLSSPSPATAPTRTPVRAPAPTDTTTTDVASSGPPTPAPTTPAPRPKGPADPPGPPPVASGPFVGPGDGTWTPAGRLVGGSAAVYTTTLHHTGQPLAAAWLDTSGLGLALYAGTTQPVGTWVNDGAIAPAQQSTLVAAFNSGFQLKESLGGWYADGRVAVPLRVGAASLVIRADGSATVGAWGRDVTLASNVVAVRQNLDLLVDGGQATPAAFAPDAKVWGDPLHENVVTWRSALGVTAAGDLIYAAGPAILPADLATAMVALGAQRAMELDINPEWVTFDTFVGTPPALTGTKLLASMNFPPTHFFASYWRDFIAAFARPAP